MSSHLSLLLAQSRSTSADGGSAIMLIVYLAILVFVIAGVWKTFEKAGQPGWAAIVPIYNVYVMLQVAGRPGWWLILFFIPFVNVIVGIITCLDIARNFGKGTGFGIGLALLGFIFFPILGFSDAQYQARRKAVVGETAVITIAAAKKM